MSTNDHKKQIFETQVGQSAKVEREGIDSELARRLNEVLRDVGRELNPELAPHYVGTFCVHAYQTPKLRQMFFQCQVLREPTCNPEVASKGIAELEKQARKAFGMGTGASKRSGW